MYAATLWYAGTTMLALWCCQWLGKQIVKAYRQVRLYLVRLTSALQFLETQQNHMSPFTGVIVEGSVFAETLCDKVLRLIRTTDVKLGETLSLQLRQHEEIEALVREFGKEFGNQVHDLGYRIDKLEASMFDLVEQLEFHADTFKRMRRACEDHTLRAKALVINNETNFKQVKMAYGLFTLEIGLGDRCNSLSTGHACHSECQTVAHLARVTNVRFV